MVANSTQQMNRNALKSDISHQKGERKLHSKAKDSGYAERYSRQESLSASLNVEGSVSKLVGTGVLALPEQSQQASCDTQDPFRPGTEEETTNKNEMLVTTESSREAIDNETDSDVSSCTSVSSLDPHSRVEDEDGACREMASDTSDVDELIKTFHELATSARRKSTKLKQRIMEKEFKITQLQKEKEDSARNNKKKIRNLKNKQKKQLKI